MGTTHKARPATPAEIAKFGHIASAIRAFLKVKDWDVGDLNAAMGRPRGHTGLYGWMNARGGPGPEYLPKLAKAIGVPEDQLVARTGQPRLALEAPDKPARPSVKPAGPSVKLEAASVKPRPGEALAFTVQADGQARIRLDVTLPLALATPLLRMIMDAGVVFAAPAPTSEAAE